MNDWQPIETAPKDGTMILAFYQADMLPYAVWFHEGEWIDPDDTPPGFRQSDITHWKPIPELPDQNGNGT